MLPSRHWGRLAAGSGPGACGVTGQFFPQDAGPNKLACFPGGGDAVGDDGGAPGDAGDTFGHRAVDRGLVDNHGTGRNVSAREGAREAKRLCVT